MLNAMFNKIQKTLGNQYGLFREFNPNVWRNKEILDKYTNIGVLYVNNGNLNKLPDGAMMEINYTLQLFMRIDDKVNVADVIVEPLNKLAKQTTGEVFSPVNNEAVQYFLDIGLPTSDGEIVAGEGNRSYIRYELPVAVVFTNGISIADNKGIVITIDGTLYALNSVLSVVEVPQTQLDTSTFVNSKTTSDGYTYNAMSNESMVVASGWSIQINKLYRAAEDGEIRKCILTTPNKVVTVKYKDVDHRVILHDCNFASELGQAEVMTINASAAMRGV